MWEGHLIVVIYHTKCNDHLYAGCSLAFQDKPAEGWASFSHRSNRDKRRDSNSSARSALLWLNERVREPRGKGGLTGPSSLIALRLFTSRGRFLLLDQFATMLHDAEKAFAGTRPTASFRKINTDWPLPLERPLRKTRSNGARTRRCAVRFCRMEVVDVVPDFPAPDFRV